jgi:hypothetical protein
MCQLFFWLAFEWIRKALKCLQVTGLKVEEKNLEPETEIRELGVKS